MGGSVNQGAQAAEQANQVQGQQYAAQQQKAAQDQINAWLAANKPPTGGAGAGNGITPPPTGGAPAVIGGAKAMPTPQPIAGSPAAQAPAQPARPPGAGALTPQLRQQIMSMLGGQH